MYCKNCGKELPAQVAFCPICGAQVEGAVPGAKVSAKTSLYSPIADFILLLAGILVIVSFFIPWVMLGAAGYGSTGVSPLQIIQEGGAQWWLFVIPLAMVIAGFVELLMAVFRIITKGKGLWRRWWYFSDGVAYIVAGVVWWVLVMYTPSVYIQGVYVSLSDLAGQGLTANFGAGLILLIVAGALDIVAGIVSLAAKKA